MPCAEPFAEPFAALGGEVRVAPGGGANGVSRAAEPGLRSWFVVSEFIVASEVLAAARPSTAPFGRSMSARVARSRAACPSRTAGSKLERSIVGAALEAGTAIEASAGGVGVERIAEADSRIPACAVDLA